eukprot:scaffold8179_cov430-Prasinococcus_capsulatus_cf.AAC.3
MPERPRSGNGPPLGPRHGHCPRATLAPRTAAAGLAKIIFKLMLIKLMKKKKKKKKRSRPWRARAAGSGSGRPWRSLARSAGPLLVREQALPGRKIGTG